MVRDKLSMRKEEILINGVKVRVNIPDSVSDEAFEEDLR